MGSHRQVFRQEIRNEIKEAIFSGTLKPGDKIIETYWAKELGVSQGPVREAIRDLEALGLVETIPFKGSRVRSMTEKDIQDNYSVRICLESKSIRDVISTLTDEELSLLMMNLKEVLLLMEKSAEQADLRQFTDNDTAFHRAIIDATGNAVLFKLWEQCNMRLWFTFSSLTDKGSLMMLLSEHQKIYTAIQKRDAETAVLSLEKHLTSMMKGFIQADTSKQTKD